MEESDGSSSAQSKRSLANKTPEPCLVCGVPTSTLHLQVNVCYACAAFYRRSIHAHTTYRCQKNNCKCDLTVKTIGKPLCRLCRYNKCVEVGMIINKSRGSSYDEFTQDLTDFSSIDLEEIYDKIKKIFELQLHSHFWETFNLFERCFQAHQHFGNDADDNRIPVDDSQYVDLSDLSYLFGENDSKYVFLAPFLEKASSFLNTFKKTNVTTVEFAYMSQIALWSCY
uniref:Nuclear receptor domain-containing protein n=1 Tax=Panagrolaimus sp. ES5 TaxID=591445 RepID=A0AC34G6A6_9BILA